MFYQRRTLRDRLDRKKLGHLKFEHIGKLAAGLHAANGLAHGVSPSEKSGARH